MPRTMLPLLAAGVAALSLAACDTTGMSDGTYGSTAAPPESPAAGSSHVPTYADPAANLGVSPPYSDVRNPSGNSR